MIAILASGVLFAGGPAQASAQGVLAPPSSLAPDGYRTVQSPALPDRLVEITSDSTFSIVVERAVDDEAHRRMIHIAERLVPTSEHMDANLEAGLRPHMTRGNWPNTLQEARDAESEHGPRWWWTTQSSNTFLPVALVAPAVHHYVELLRSRTVMPGERAHLSYSARVEAVEGEEPGWVVVLEVRSTYQCGTRCGLIFDHDRRVYFDGEGNPVRVEGDRLPGAEVF